MSRPTVMIADVEHTQCTRCKGFFPSLQLVECVTPMDEWLADLCDGCLQGWMKYEQFLEDSQ